MEKLHEKLQSMDPLSLWSEPVEFLPQPSENFFNTIDELLTSIAAKDLDKMNPLYRSELLSLQVNAVQSVFGLAVVSGSFEMIVQALSTIRSFCDKASESNIKDVFERTQPALKSYLE